MDIRESLNKLFALHTFGIKLGLDNIRLFLDQIGNPQAKLKTFHIAGSNGKGSTASFIASILMENGYKVGLYTSPHFISFNERISVNGAYIPDNFVADFINRYESKIDELKLTFFEVTTAMAFEYFADKNVDFAVIETGLGGRLDATNVLNPLACIITSISLEHTNVLGDKIEAIAFEKSEIIKKHCKTFIGLLPEEAIKVIEKKCTDVKADLFCLEEYIIEKNGSIELYTEELEFDDWHVPLTGLHQKYNAALAALTVAKTLDIEDPLVITKGLKNIIKNTRLQGRYEIAKKSPKIILDSAHNPEGIKSLINEFSTERNKYKKASILFGVMKDKNVEEMLYLIKDTFDEFYFYHINYERAADFSDIKNITDKLEIKFNQVPDLKEFFIKFIDESKDNCIVVAGSMYLLGEVKTILPELVS